MPRKGQRIGVEKRFWKYVTKGAEDACWEWCGSRQPKGYGTFRVEGRTLKTHRVSYELHKGPIPEGLWVLHKCDNPPCVNPAHLWLGTNADNVADKTANGRAFRLIGERHHKAKITDEIVRKIRAEWAAGGKTYPQIGAMFSINSEIVGRVVRRKSWRHVE